MKNRKTASGFTAETIWARIRKMSRLFSDVSGTTGARRDSQATAPPITPGRGNIRWKDYHPNPSAPPRAPRRLS